MTQATFTETQKPKRGTLPFGLTGASVALGLIMIVAAGLRLINPEAFGAGNTYYTAAVENMLQSASNFFYAVADAGGVTVDKPPVALWIQAAFASVFGVSGFVVTLPSIIAGSLSVLVLYHLVKRHFGITAGLIAALVLAITPISVAVDRTNNLDSILIFTLLLATWGFVRAVDTGKWWPLLLGAALVGVGFNVKMLQAYLILPALYGFYFFSVKLGWINKIVRLSVATVLLFAVSFSWAIAVDLTPADQRPYVGGSESNSVIELAIGYNGLSRLLGNDFGGGRGNDGGQRAGNDGRQPPTDGNATGQPPAGRQGGGGPGGFDEIGNAGITRMFEASLANELAWLLPFALLSIGILGVRKITFPLSREQQAVMLWGGWLMTGVVFFSVSSFFHAYYLATLAPALAALVGIGAVKLWDIFQDNRMMGIGLASLLWIVTLAYQIFALSYYEINTMAFLIPVGSSSVVLLGVIVLSWRKMSVVLQRAIAIGYLASLLMIPSLWGVATAISPQSTTLPAAYAGENAQVLGAPPSGTSNAILDDLELLEGVTYDLVVSSSMVGSQIVLNTDLGVLYMGGFGGNDQIYTVDNFSAMIANGAIGYVLSGSRNAEVEAYVAETCLVVEEINMADMMRNGRGGDGNGAPQGFPPPPAGGNGGRIPGGFASSMTLYNCAG